MKMLKFILFSSLSCNLCYAQFSPAAGRPGSIAIYKDSSIITLWANVCHVKRGYQNITDSAMGYATSGSDESATGKALEKGVVSLGDGGYAILEFPKPITNGPGFDFAVFENGFDDYFLELAFVEVSSDGINYFRFPSVSNTDTSDQKKGFDTLDTRKIHNLAGKFMAGYGTPFDLEELKNKQGLNINKITYLRILDVIGNIDPRYAVYDSKGNKINDPWPTPFPEGGFDLDAVGVIHYEGQSSMDEIRETKSEIQIYPTFLRENQRLILSISEKLRGKEIQLTIMDITGKRMEVLPLNNLPTKEIFPNYPKGVYIIKVIYDGEYFPCKKFIIL